MFIPDPTFFHPGSRIRTVFIPDPGSLSKNLSILTPKKAKKWFLSSKKWFLSSKKYDPGCSSRIRMLTFSYPGSPIPDPGVKKAPNPGSRIRIRNTGTYLVPILNNTVREEISSLLEVVLVRNWSDYMDATRMGLSWYLCCEYGLVSGSGHRNTKTSCVYYRTRYCFWKAGCFRFKLWSPLWISTIQRIA